MAKKKIKKKRVPRKTMKSSKKRTPKKSKKLTKVEDAKPRTLSSAELRRKAETDFLKDPDAHSIDWHYRNGEYERYVAIDTFRYWAKKGNWTQRRVEYWENIQKRVLENLADKILETKIKEIEEMVEMRDSLITLLKPLRDKTGKIKINSETGLPMFGVPLPSYDRLAKAFLDLDMRIGLRTGDVTNRIETVNTERESGTSYFNNPADPVSNMMNISKEEAALLARQLVMSRDKHLHDDSDVIDMVEEDDDDESL